MRRLSEIFDRGPSDIICEPVNYEKQIYYCAHLKERVIVRARRENNKLRLQDIIFAVVLQKVICYEDPFTRTRKFEVEFIGNERILPSPIKLGPAEIPDLVALLRNRGLVYNSKLAENALSAILNAYLRRGLAEIHAEIDKPDFYMRDGKVVPVRVEVREPSKEELKRALLLLNELATIWYGHVQEKFATIIKWGIVAPFNFIYKQRRLWIPWLFLWGPSGVGKTTLGKIVLSIWGLSSEYEKAGTNIDTVSRLGQVLSQSTFPVLINEPGTALTKEEIIEMMKAAVESTVARGKFVRGQYIEIPALAPLIFTSNRTPPNDDALQRRLIIVKFTFSEKINLQKAEQFERTIKPRLVELRAIGQYVAKRILDDPSLLELDWRELSEKLLVEAYREVGLTPPGWIKLWYHYDVREVYESLIDDVRRCLRRLIDDLYARHIGRVIDAVSVEERVRAVLERGLLPGAYLKNDTVIITSELLSELRERGVDVGDLSDLASLLGWQYRSKYSFRVSGKVLNRSCILVKLRDLVAFLEPEVVEVESEVPEYEVEAVQEGSGVIHYN